MMQDSSDRSEQETAAQLKRECLAGNFQPLRKHLDDLLDPSKEINDPQVLSACKTLIAGGLDFEKFEEQMKEHDHSAMCNKTLRMGKTAYRCYSCATNDAMALCDSCFESGDHHGHETRMYTAQGNGTCDCGNPSALRESGFCSHHGAKKQTGGPTAVLRELTIMAQEILPRLLKRLLFYLREKFVQTGVKGVWSYKYGYVNKYIPFGNMMQEINELGDTMLNITAAATIDEHQYKQTTDLQPDSHEGQMYQKFLEKKMEIAPFPPEFEKYKDRFENMVLPTEYSTMVEELVFFLNFYVFEEPLKSFLLYLFGDDHFKIAFSKSFMRHYPQMVWRLQQEDPFSYIPDKMALVTAQVYVFEATAVEMAKHQNALFVILLSLLQLVETELEGIDREDPSNTYRQVQAEGCVVMGRFILNVAANLNTILIHPSVAFIFMKDPELMSMLIKVTAYVQGIFVNTKLKGRGYNHFDPETYMHTFNVEDRVLASNMELIAEHCQHPDTLPFVLNTIKELKSALETWFQASHTDVDTQLNPDLLTYHIPLHRSLATWIKTAVNDHGVDLSQILPDGPFARKLLKHVLHIEAGNAEVNAKRWVRNGPVVESQCHFHQYPAFAKAMLIPDMYLMQVCAMQINADFFVLSVLKSFGLLDWLSNVDDQSEKEDPAILQMLQSVCVLFSTLLGLQTTLESGEKERMRRDLSAILSSENFTFSEILLKLPLRMEIFSEKRQILEDLLKELTESKTQSDPSLEQHKSTYSPKAEFWDKDFDPVSTNFRMREPIYVQQAVARYKQHLQDDKGLAVKKKDVWPPFKLESPCNQVYRNMLHMFNCKTMHAFLFAVLHRAVAQPGDINDTVLSHVVHLLTACVHSAETKQPEPSAPELAGNPLGSMYKSNDIIENVCHIIEDVVVPVPLPADTVEKEGSSVDHPTMQTDDAGPGTMVSVSVKESIISLLIKLSTSGNSYKPQKLSATPALNQPIEGGGGQEYIARLLNHFYTKSTVAENLIDQICAQIQPMDIADEATKRHRKAQRAREKQLAKLQSDQKKFKETSEAMDVDSDHSQGSDEAAMDTSPTSGQYQCILCRKTEESLGENPIGVLAYIQASGVLGKRRQDHPVMTTDISAQKPNKDSFCDAIYKRKQEILERNFSHQSSEMALNEGWHNGTVVQTCGHYVHLACLTQLRESQAPICLHAMYIPQYRCPLCQQFYNDVIPMLPEVKRMTSEDFNSPMSSEDIIKALTVQRSKVGVQTIENSIDHFMEFLPLILYADRDYQSVSVLGIDNELAYLASVVRANVEVELMNAGGTVKQANPKPEEQESFNVLLRAIRQRIRDKTTSDPFVRLWKDLTNQDQQPASDNKVPMFLRDPITLLIYFILGLPENIAQEHYDFVANLLFGLVYVNATLYLGITLSKDEQKAVVKACDKTTNGVLKTTLQWMVDTGLSCEEKGKQEMWSVKKVEDCVKEFCLPFLRISALLKKSVFCVEIPTQQADSNQEYQQLCEFLKVQPPKEQLPKKWYNQLSDFVKEKPLDTRTLLQSHPKWLQPDLIPLPREFYTLYNKFTCDKCKAIVQDVGICLVCGDIVLRGRHCCEECSFEEEMKHIKHCGWGSSVFLFLRTSLILIHRGPRELKWGSIYLDEHGEEDLNLDRGRPLYLKEDRLNIVKRLWRTHTTDRIIHRKMTRNEGDTLTFFQHPFMPV